MPTSFSSTMLQAAGRGMRAMPAGQQSQLRAFAAAQWHADGGFCDRSGRADLYYSVFGLAITAACVSLPQPDGTGVSRASCPQWIAAGRLMGFLGAQARRDDLDMVHLCSLARAWRFAMDIPLDLPPGHPFGQPKEVQSGLGARLRRFCCPSGAYHHSSTGQSGSTYGCFLAVGAMQDLGLEEQGSDAIADCLAQMRTADGGYMNDADLPMANTPSTAAAIMIRSALGLAADEAAAGWLLSQQRDDGGFVAVPQVPLADLLSTATALMALESAGVVLPAGAAARARGFAQGLWNPRGGFCGSSFDDSLDCEYTFYGLVCMGAGS